MYKKRIGVVSFGDQPIATTGKFQSAALFAGAVALVALAVAPAAVAAR